MPVPAYKRVSSRPVVSHAFRWRDLSLSVAVTRDVINLGWTHLELPVIEPLDAPLPLGYSSLYVVELDEDELAARGGPVTLLLAMLDDAGSTRAYAAALFRHRQGLLF